MTGKKIFMTLLTVLLVLVSLGGHVHKGIASGNPESEVVHLRIGTASVGGVYYPIGIAAAQIWNRCIPGVKAVAIATAGSPQNLNMLNGKDIDVAVCRQVEAYKAMMGLEPYREPMPWVRAITGGLFLDAMQILALKDRDIESIADFRGKKIAVGPIGSGGEADAREVLKIYGLTYKDIQPEYIEASQAVDMMKDGLIDGAILGLSLGSSAISELMLTGRVKLLSIEDFAFEKARGEKLWVQRRVIPKNIYPNQDYEVVSFGKPPDVLIVREDMPENLVYHLTKSLYENVEEMRRVAAVMEQFSVDLVLPEDEMLIPYHIGSKKYFEEIDKIH